MIEDKISRLTPEQQREVEDFIDFLITRDANTPITPIISGVATIFLRAGGDVTQPAPMIFAEERPVAGRTDQDILPDYPEYGGPGTVGKTREPEQTNHCPPQG